MINKHLCRWGLIAVFLTAVSMLILSCSSPKKPSVTREQATVDFDLLLTLPATPISYEQQVRPILDSRCVVCHGCYDAPCQLKLSSYEGLDRGANKKKVYDGSRILPMSPTRLFVDAKTTEQWRDKGFYPVLNEGHTSPEENLQNSVLYRILRLKQRHPQPRVGMLPDTFDLELDRKQECPTLETFDSFAERHPLWGMPYAMPVLEDSEYRTLTQWIAQGAPPPPSAQPSAEAAPQIERWETFLNGASLKQQLVSRYIFEHLVQAHIHFQGTSPREFYRLVRSHTPPGQPVDEIATIRPYGDPGTAPFYYRLLRYHPSIVAKDHVVYEWSDRRMDRYRDLFLKPAYTVKALPSYQATVASNPFKVFKPIPPLSRYRFLLDDARFFIEGFMKGPVCRGQVALNVIEDQFWVLFFDPDRDMISNDPQFIDSMTDYLQLPADREDHLNLLSIWTDYWVRQKRYLAARESDFQQIHALNLEDALGYIWNGDGHNPNAAMTVFRHFDSASVTYGLVGDYPETAWVIDYPLLERIHYLLVAGYSVYGNVGHQLNTRIFMDFLRMEGEDNFLAFLPVSHRKAIRDQWYVGLRAGLEREFKAPMDWLNVESVIGYKTDNPQLELYQHLERRLGPIAGPEDLLNRCTSGSCRDPEAEAAEAQADEYMRQIARIRGPVLEVFPDVTFVRVRTGHAPERDLAYTVIRNKAYKNISSIFEDEDRRDRDNDTLTVVNWLEGSYPNFFFIVDIDDMQAFTERYVTTRTREDYERFVGLYGVRRTYPGFWSVADWFQDQYIREASLRAGLFDLNRYRNR